MFIKIEHPQPLYSDQELKQIVMSDIETIFEPIRIIIMTKLMFIPRDIHNIIFDYINSEMYRLAAREIFGSEHKIYCMETDELLGWWSFRFISTSIVFTIFQQKNNVSLISLRWCPNITEILGWIHSNYLKWILWNHSLKSNVCFNPHDDNILIARVAYDIQYKFRNAAQILIHWPQ